MSYPLTRDEHLDLPFVSVIVATRNEEKHIGKLLDSLIEQTYPKKGFEVIIVDGISNDGTLRIVEEHRDCLNIRMYENPRIKSTYAFNKGIDEAKGNLFMIVSAHSILSSDFVEREIDTFVRVRKEEPKLAGVGGVLQDKPENPSGKVVSLVYSSFFSGMRTCRYLRKPHFSDSVIFGLFDKNIVVSNGKFDEDFVGAGNDDELPLRLRSKGFKFYTNPEIVASYFPRNSFRSFIKQTFNYGVAKGLIVRKGYGKIEWMNPASFWFIPASFLIYEMLLLHLFGLANSHFVVALIPFILYWLIGIIVSLDLWIKTRSLLCLALPLVFLVFHNILGLSSLIGLIFGKKAFS